MHKKYSIQFIQAHYDDIEYLINLRNETMSEHFRNSRLTHTINDMRERVLYRLDCAKIILIDGERAGLVKVIKDGNEWELSQIQITRKYQGKGIGNIIVSEIITEANQSGSRVVLTVLKTNPAKKLYERLGFIVIKESDHSFRMSTLPKDNK
jgi:ribosomal protein S18 acetylase RimI-like enzyme